LRQFSIVMNETRGNPAKADLDAFFAAGYSKENVFEVIVGTAFKVMSNYTNHIAETEVDAPFAVNAWSADNA
ncbi:MAG: carboxymuconolactone decarboxylase family protein, partial [Hyphomicrobiales bacterium]